MIAASSLLSLLLTLVIVGCIFWLLWWLVAYIGLPAPFDKVARVILAVVAVFILIDLLLGLAGTPLIRWR